MARETTEREIQMTKRKTNKRYVTVTVIESGEDVLKFPAIATESSKGVYNINLGNVPQKLCKLGYGFGFISFNVNLKSHKK